MNAWLPSLMMGIERGEEQLRRQKEYLADLERQVAEEKRKLHNEAVEECARVAERYFGNQCNAIAKDIRALKI